jgi:hypothetical protein
LRIDRQHRQDRWRSRLRAARGVAVAIRDLGNLIAFHRYALDAKPLPH